MYIMRPNEPYVNGKSTNSRFSFALWKHKLPIMDKPKEDVEMKGRKKGAWRGHLRRFCALFCATWMLWLVWMTGDREEVAGLLEEVAQSPSFAAAALAVELGERTGEGEVPWQKWVTGQSPLLSTPLESLPSPSPTPVPSPETEPDDPQDLQELPAVTQAPDDILPKTLTHREGNLALEQVSIHNTTSQSVDVTALAAAPVELALTGEAPEILIMHTHGSEAYTMDGTDIYLPSDNSRTVDPAHNVVRIGEEIAAGLTEQGFSVLHDPTLHDYPAYNGAYGRSQAAVEEWLAQYPSIQVVLDVHRDALLGENGETCKTVSVVDGVEMAQVMLVVGSNDSGLEHPDWRENLALAMRVQQRLNESGENFARPITIRTSRFNQHLTQGSLLVEVGSHGNTLQEALAAARVFAQRTGAVLRELSTP